MGCNWHGNSAGWSLGGIIGPKPSPKTASIVTIPANGDTSDEGSITGWSFPRFDESTSAVLRLKDNDEILEDVQLSFDDEITLQGMSTTFDVVYFGLNEVGASTFFCSANDSADYPVTLELLSFDHNGKKLFP